MESKERPRDEYIGKGAALVRMWSLGTTVASCTTGTLIRMNRLTASVRIWLENQIWEIM